jgi:hypothetical protein
MGKFEFKKATKSWPGVLHRVFVRSLRFNLLRVLLSNRLIAILLVNPEPKVVRPK